MKIYKRGDKKSVLCHRDGRVTATFDYRSVPFRDGRGIVDSVLVGVCDVCGDAVIIPAQSTPAIAEAREKISKPLEVNLPAIFLDLLDAAITRVSSHPSIDFRKQLIAFYVSRYASGEEQVAELLMLSAESAKLMEKISDIPKKRLSMKFSEEYDSKIMKILSETKLSKTEVVKSIILKINQDVVDPARPKHQRDLANRADALYA